jgi:hypothetical protein
MIASRPSGFIEPCQPSKAARPPSGPLWVHEIKHDGYRLMVRRDDARVRCFTRNGHDHPQPLAEGSRPHALASRRGPIGWSTNMPTKVANRLAATAGPAPKPDWFRRILPRWPVL